MIGIVVFGGIVVVAFVVLSRFSIVGSTALDPPEPNPQPPEPPDDGDGLVSVWRILGPVAMIGAAGSVGVAATTYLPDPLGLPRAIVVAFWIPVVPLAFLTVATLARMQGDGRNILDTIESAAPAAWPTAALLLALFVLLAFTGGRGPSGDAQIRDGRYVLIHGGGAMTEITYDEYEQAESRDRRTGAAVAGVFYTPGIALGLYARGRHRQHGR